MNCEIYFYFLECHIETIKRFEMAYFDNNVYVWKEEQKCTSIKSPEKENR